MTADGHEEEQHWVEKKDKSKTSSFIRCRKVKSTYGFHSRTLFLFFFSKYSQHAGPRQSEGATPCVCVSLCLVLNVGWAGVFFIPVFQMRREVPEELEQRH